MIEVICIIKNEKYEWEETLPVQSLETAKEDIKEIVKDFNASLKPYELPRQFVNIVKEKITRRFNYKK